MSERLVTILYFAAVAELVGQREESFSTDAASVGALMAALEARHPALRGRLDQVRFAVNETFARATDPIAPGDVVAVIPPVAGGSPIAPSSDRVAITREPLSIERVCALVRHPGAGALATFVGVVRDHSDGRSVEALEYSAYEPMALKEMAAIIDAIEEEIPGVRLAAHHRIGPLVVGDDAIVCVASSPHRDEAFVAGRALIDRIKEHVPIWKREKSPGEDRWIGWE